MTTTFAGGHPPLGPGLAPADDFPPDTVPGLPAGLPSDPGGGLLVDAESREGPKAFAVSSNKPLTSKYRGVCWNKKNKRWQSAINSSGKYLYLGSYDAEEDAARVFDKAAVRIRYDKARLNFHFNDYVDEAGNILPDQQVEALLLEACNPTKPRRQRNKSKTQGPEGAGAEGADGRGLGTSAPPPKTDATSAEIALQALARLCGPGGPGTANPELAAAAAAGANNAAGALSMGPTADASGMAYPMAGVHQQPRMHLPPMPLQRHSLEGLPPGLGPGYSGGQPPMAGSGDGGMQLQALLEGGLGTLNAQSLSRHALLQGFGAGGLGGPGGLGPGPGPGSWGELYSNGPSAAAALAALHGHGQGQQGQGHPPGLANLLGSMPRGGGPGVGPGSHPMLRPMPLGGSGDPGAAMSALGGVNVPPHVLQEMLAASGQPYGAAAAQQLRPGMLNASGAGQAQGGVSGNSASPHDMYSSHPQLQQPQNQAQHQAQQPQQPPHMLPVHAAGSGAHSAPSNAAVVAINTAEGRGGGAMLRSDVFTGIKGQLPHGAELDSIIPSGNPDVLGVLYSLRDSAKHGAGIWAGHRFNSLGFYGSDKDAKQSISGALSIYRDMGHQAHSQGLQAGRPPPVSIMPGSGAAAPPTPTAAASVRDRAMMTPAVMAGPAGATGPPGALPGGAVVKTEMGCLGPVGWQPDPTCEDPQSFGGGGVSEDESGTGAGGGGTKRRREGGGDVQGQPSLGNHGRQSCGGAVGYGADDPVLPDDGAMAGGHGGHSMEGGANKRPRGPGAGTTDLSTLQNLANIDVREALRMFFTGKQQG